MTKAARSHDKPPGLPARRRWPRGPVNELHNATRDGSVRRTDDLLSRGSVDIDQGDPRGWTPLMCAAGIGNRTIVGMLLSKGANLSVMSDYEFTALHISAQEGQLAVTEMMAKACAPADLEAVNYEGFTPLHVAVQVKQPAVVRALIEAGANFNCRTPTGETPLYTAAMRGYMDVVKVLLKANANPLLPRIDPAGYTYVPLDVAAQSGHPGVVQALIRQFGIAGCGGESGGVDALTYAAQEHHTHVLAMLAEVGVVDNGVALHAAVQSGREASVKFLLKQHGNTAGKPGAYANVLDDSGSTPFLRGIAACRPRSARIMRLLADAGADTTSAVQVRRPFVGVAFDDTPLALVTNYIRENRVDARPATQEELHRLKTIRRLVLHVGAMHAVAWLWPSDATSTSRAAPGARPAKRVAPKTSRALTSVLPILRRRARKPRVALPPLMRLCGKK
ncbi:unnamed protein product [Scytosiphon promiscuus]